MESVVVPQLKSVAKTESTHLPKLFFSTPTESWRPWDLPEVSQDPIQTWFAVRRTNLPVRTHSWTVPPVSRADLALGTGRTPGWRRETGCTCCPRWWRAVTTASSCAQNRSCWASEKSARCPGWSRLSRDRRSGPKLIRDRDTSGIGPLPGSGCNRWVKAWMEKVLRDYVGPNFEMKMKFNNP